MLNLLAVTALPRIVFLGSRVRFRRWWIYLLQWSRTDVRLISRIHNPHGATPLRFGERR